jgi:hypothetical protein
MVQICADFKTGIKAASFIRNSGKQEELTII